MANLKYAASTSQSESMREKVIDAQNPESRSFMPWVSSEAPERVLFIRLQAIGDVAVTLPACSAFRRRYPQAHLSILTSESCSGIPSAVDTFDCVFTMRQHGFRGQRAVEAVMTGVRMHRKCFDVVIDLQRHRRSRIIRLLARPKAWGEFDRSSPESALARTLDTLARAGFHDLIPDFKLNLKEAVRSRSREILRRNGWDGCSRLVVLNPAGVWATKNWPLQRYEDLAALWLRREPVQFLFLGTERLYERTRALVNRLGDKAVDLICRTSLSEALGALQDVSVVISEDSGLLHMAWVSGVPTVALLGATRSDWARPLGPLSRFVSSEDLPCGACMQPVCRHGDVHCLSRYSAETILKLALEVGRRS